MKGSLYIVLSIIIFIIFSSFVSAQYDYYGILLFNEAPEGQEAGYLFFDNIVFGGGPVCVYDFKLGDVVTGILGGNRELSFEDMTKVSIRTASKNYKNTKVTINRVDVSFINENSAVVNINFRFSVVNQSNYEDSGSCDAYIGGLLLPNVIIFVNNHPS